MISGKKQKIALGLFLAVLVLGVIQAKAQDATLASSTQDSAKAKAVQAELQQQLLDIQNQIAVFEKQLSEIKGQKNTLQNKINSLKKTQASLNLQIKATSMQIANLDGQISDTAADIIAKQVKTELMQEEVAQALRLISQSDQRPFLYSLVQNENLSGVLDDAQATSAISNHLSQVLEQVRVAKAQLEDQKVVLIQQQDDAKNLLSVQALQQTQLQSSVNDQNVLLQETKGKETDYQITLSDTKRRAAEIQGRIYDLLGISSQITFGEAYKIALWVSQQNGIDPAFLLAILTQESNLGKNVGTCNRPGDPPEKSYKVMMKPDRDQQPFLQITSDLGLDPEVTPISCAMKDKKGKRLGWGGAMGPAQFIPSTWMGYKDKVTAITGKAANPWDIRDAFLASGIKLKAGGADGTDQGNWNAAMRYFSGSTNVKYRFYGDSVLSLTQKYQADIATLLGQ